MSDHLYIGRVASGQDGYSMCIYITQNTTKPALISQTNKRYPSKIVGVACSTEPIQICYIVCFKGDEERTK